MPAIPEIVTPRLRLRAWRREDLQPFGEMCADPEVRRYFMGILSAAESEAMVGRIQDHWEQNGFGFWVLEIPEVTPFIGYAGLLRVGFEAHFVPCVEVGWGLARSFWGHGFATEAGQAALQFGFTKLGLDEIVSFTAVANDRSRRVMERLEMKRDEADDFEHPRVPEGNPLRRHVLYRLPKTGWRGQRSASLSRVS